MFEKPRRSYFNGIKSLSQTNEAASTIIYSHSRYPHSTDISLDTKIFLTPLRNYYTQRGNTLYNWNIINNQVFLIILYIGNSIFTFRIKRSKYF